MKVLIIGSGAREYSIGLALKKDKNCSCIYFAPGNGATPALGENVALANLYDLAKFALDNKIDLTIVGCEEPLSNGIVNIFRQLNLTIFGPTQAAAMLEASKAFMKNFLAKYAIPTAKYIETNSLEKAEAFINTLNPPIVVKADGLCGGKGVVIARNLKDAKLAAEEMLSGTAFGTAGKRVVIEEFLDGYELSVFAITDGTDFITLPICQDHKRLLTGDLGPNTGGMGAYCPTPLVNKTLLDKIKTKIIRATINGMRSEGTPFEGVLFCGVMVVNGEPFVLEFNVRFGDPECESLMPLIKTSVVDLFYKAATNRLKEIDIGYHVKFAAGVMVASAGYPTKVTPPQPITIEPGAERSDAHISYAGVTMKDGTLYASGGRVLACVGLGSTLLNAVENAYDLVKKVHFEGMQYRNDIAYQAVKR
ncbi:MAG: phosphoribosylamine--glycine ligase [Helicobacteraceae bacterium]|jgi:phosphoribosylamine--glycine ligase|nr:phosphoribosylamine--glycine ligase [Helicobacteraceae bacterium]